MRTSVFLNKTNTSGEYELSECEKITDCKKRQGNESEEMLIDCHLLR